MHRRISNFRDAGFDALAAQLESGAVSKYRAVFFSARASLVFIALGRCPDYFYNSMT
jgi:hypothetical protein